MNRLGMGALRSELQHHSLHKVKATGESLGCEDGQVCVDLKRTTNGLPAPQGYGPGQRAGDVAARPLAAEKWRGAKDKTGGAASGVEILGM